MTERLYYTDPALLEFEATIVAVTPQDDRFSARLDRSAFYPASGGQLSDRGTLGDAQVIDVVEQEDGDVLHILDREPGKTGEKVSGRVEKARRTRHRQQHTAQHILSQVLIRLFDAETVSVHLGEEYGAVEIAKESLTAEELCETEIAANEIVAENLPVTIRFVSKQEAATLPLRKIPDREGTIRLIQIGELDYSACGGTHCHSTAEVGLIKLLSATRQRGNLLITFLAGTQAMEDYRLRFDISEQLARDLTCHLTDLPDKLAKLTDENKNQRQQITALQKELLPLRVEQLATTAQTIGNHSLVISKIADLDPKTAGQLASLVAEQTTGTVLLLVENRLLIATGSASPLDAKAITAALCEQTGLRGGGSPTAAQIGGADPAAFESYGRMITELLSRA